MTTQEPNNKILLLIDGKEELIFYADLLKNMNISGLIRIPSDEFEYIGSAELLGHFNLEKTGHKVGNRYLVIKIIRNGHYKYDTEEEIQPLLSLDGAFVAECLEAKNSLSYNDISPEYFTNSIRGIIDRDSLKSAIIKRYKSSRTNLSEAEIISRGVAYTLLKIIRKINGESPTIRVSEDGGYTHLQTESVSSKVFVKEGEIFKLNNRNSFARQIADLDTLYKYFIEYKNHLPNSEVFECDYEGKIYTCVKQPFISGDTLKNLEKSELDRVLTIPENKNFLLKLLDYFFISIESKELYPDLIGHPSDPEYFNSVNLIHERSTDKIILCDVGLSPHEDTLSKHGQDFYNSENVMIYSDKMRKFREVLLNL